MPNRSDFVFPLFKLMMSLFLSSHVETLFFSDVKVCSMKLMLLCDVCCASIGLLLIFLQQIEFTSLGHLVFNLSFAVKNGYLNEA